MYKTEDTLIDELMSQEDPDGNPHCVQDQQQFESQQKEVR